MYWWGHHDIITAISSTERKELDSKKLVLSKADLKYITILYQNEINNLQMVCLAVFTQNVNFRGDIIANKANEKTPTDAHTQGGATTCSHSHCVILLCQVLLVYDTDAKGIL